MQLAGKIGCQAETTYLAGLYYDALMAADPHFAQRPDELCLAACLGLATKLREPWQADNAVACSSGLAHLLARAELHAARALDWQLNHVTPHTIAEQLLAGLAASGEPSYRLAIKLVRLARLRELVHYCFDRAALSLALRTSVELDELAAGAVLASLQALTGNRELPLLLAAGLARLLDRTEEELLVSAGHLARIATTGAVQLSAVLSRGCSSDSAACSRS